jgi:hypothetical protein
MFNFDIQAAIERQIWRAIEDHRVAILAGAVVLVLIVQIVRVRTARRKK